MNTSVDKLFLIAVGGTGMRCLESFIHLCAMGMFDGKEIEVLSLDTDQANGNKSRVKNLVTTYNAIKNGGNPNSNTFFSAKINFHEFYTDYNSVAGFGNFHQITKTSTSPNVLDDNKMLADLFMESSVQVFDLTHGYRAQTHLGSYLMYHAFIETAHKIVKGDNIKDHENYLNQFCEKLRGATEGGRVFIFGSLFGGTGASSLPILPKAIEDFISITGQGKTSLPEKVKFGSTLLTEYFKFKNPDDKQRSTDEDAVIADSRFFTLNSQASLQYYQNDPTIKKCFKKMYHIGWPIEPINFSKDDEKLVKTGGPTQKNDCHIVELISAAAAFDFFQSESIDNDELSVLYKTFEVVDNNKLEISFNDLVGDGENGKKFASHFCALVQLMHLVLTQYEGSIGNNGVQTIIKNTQTNFTDYDNLDSNYTNHLNEYFREYFGYAIENKVFEGKWLYQIYKSLQGGALIFNHNIFSNDLSELEDIDFGKMWSEKNESYNWHKSLLQKFGKIGPSKFLEHFKDLDEVQKEFKNQDLVMPSEKFLAQLFNTFNSLNKITNI